METEDQRFMARQGIITWLQGTIQLATELSGWITGMHKLPQEKVANARRAFERNRLFFLVAADTFFDYRDWSVGTDALPKSSFREIDTFRSHVEKLRNKNLHVIGYLKEEDGKDWWHESAEWGRTDASATVGTKIGNRLDWVDFSKAAQRLLESLV